MLARHLLGSAEGVGVAVATLFAAAILLLATLWTVEVGAGDELDPNFELGPLGPDRVVAQEVTVRNPDMIGMQIAARAEGTIEPLNLRADLLVGDTLKATRTLQVFPSTTLHLHRVAFDRADPVGPVAVRLQALPGQPGAVVYGATREDQQPGGILRVDGQVEFADQDLALRVLYRRSLWTHLESLVGDLRAARAVAALTLTAAASGLGLIAAATARALRPSRPDARPSRP